MTVIQHRMHNLATSPLNMAYAVNASGALETAEPRRRKLAIVAASINPEEPPPLDDPTYEVWGCNSLWNLHLDQDDRFRADRWFEMHPISAQTPQELLDMHECPVPLYVLDEREEPHWITYPLNQMKAQFGERTYYTCTFAYQIALAITEEFQEIALHGVELYGGSVRERRIEFPCVTYWLGLAIGLGIQVTLPSYSKLLWHPQLYGYDYAEDVTRSEKDDTELGEVYHRESERRWKHRIRTGR